MSVVSDTTPMNYLIMIGSDDVLRRLFGRVFVPTAVLEELRDPKSPERVRRWAECPPEWLTVRDPAEPDPSLPPKLGKGEVGAISLAQEMQAALLLDDKDARKAAGERRLPMARTLTVLVEAACRDFVYIDAAVAKLRAATYRAKEEHFRDCLAEVRARKTAQGKGDPEGREGQETPQPGNRALPPEGEPS